jgi:hypothetical protein
MLQTPPKENKQIIKIYRFSVFKVKDLMMIGKERYSNHINFQVIGQPEELLEIRVYFDEDGIFEMVRCYHKPGFDAELVGYIVRYLIKWLKSK